MPDWEDLVKLWDQIFGNQITFWLLRIIGTFATIWLGLWLIAQIVEIWKNTILPIFYKADEKRRNFRRKLFAQHLENEINIVNSQENWKDHRFAELEAEVEAEGLHSISNVLPFIKREYKGLKREKSLSRALKASRARLVLLEGDPGSGKSVALRHVTLDLIRRVKRSRSNIEPLPIYVNLRGIKRSENQMINRDLIYQYVLASVNRLNDRDVEIFLDDEFQTGLREGSWFFLFDSFDEIPDVLSASEVNPIIRKYADAISEFFLGFNQCRGVVASRYFRGPGHVDWQRFNIVGLTVERQVQLVRKANMPTNKEHTLIGQLASANSEMQAMASNPLFLGMIVEHVQSGNQFPDNTFGVFKAYTAKRFEQDQDRITKRFDINHIGLKEAAQVVAFCMTADSNLGLSPYRYKIGEALIRLNLNFSFDLEKCLDALEFIKIGRSELNVTIGAPKTFSFSHRRFQEYFATSFVLEQSNQITARQLISDPRWRETAVVLCQIWPEENLQDIISVSGETLYHFAREIEQWYESIRGKDEKTDSTMPWKPGLLYLLNLLQDGFSHRRHILPDHVRSNAGFVLEIAQFYGIFPDKKWALEVAGISPQPILIEGLRYAISHPSVLLNRVAYEQVSRLEDMPEDIENWIRKSLIEKAATLRLYRERYTTQAFLSRLPKSTEFLHSLRLLLVLPIFDIFAHIILLTLFLLDRPNNILLSPPNFVGSFLGTLVLMELVFVFPFMSYLFTYQIIEGPSFFGITVHTFSFLVRFALGIIVISLVDADWVKLATGIVGYLLLIPISIIVLLNDGVSWKNTLSLFFSPLLLFVNAVKQRSLTSTSTKVVISLLGIIMFGGCMGALSGAKVVENLFKNIGWLMVLSLCSIPGMLIVATSGVKEYLLRRSRLKDDRKRFRAWDENKVQQLTGQSFLERFAEYETLEYLHKFVIDIASKDILEKNENGEQALKEAIRLVESWSGRRKRVELIDDLCVFLERIQKNREA